MTTPRNPDRLIRTYLQEDEALGHHEVPEHVYGAIRDGIEQTRQRAVIGSMGVPDMNKFLAIGLGTAAVVVALLIGSNLNGFVQPAAGRCAVPIGGAFRASPVDVDWSPRRPVRGHRRRRPRAGHRRHRVVRLDPRVGFRLHVERTTTARTRRKLSAVPC